MNREGFALWFVLVVVAALQLLGLSTLALATHESVLVDSHERTLLAHRTAESALRTFARDSARLAEVDSLHIGEWRNFPVGDVAIRVTRRRWGLFDAEAAVPARPSFVRMRAVLRKLDLGYALAEANEAVVTAGLLQAPNATHDVASTETCAQPLAAPRPGRALTVSAPRFAFGNPEAVVDSVHAVTSPGYAFAGIRWSEAGAVADVALPEVAVLSAADSTGRPMVKLMYAPGDLTVSGSGAGVLLVDGNLHVLAGARFDGVIVVRGTVTIEDDVAITGSLRVQGRGASRIGAARITFARCAVIGGILGSPAASRFVPGGRRFLPSF